MLDLEDIEHLKMRIINSEDSDKACELSEMDQEE